MAGKTSIENGRKGGRPLGSKDPHTLEREQARAFLISKIKENIEPIADALIGKAKQGDVPAIKELFDRAWGKPNQSISGLDNTPIQVDITDALNKVYGDRV